MSDLEHCFNLGGKIIVLQENETRFYIENDNDIDQKIAKIQIDGCLVTKANISKRCDWLLILLKNYTEIYIYRIKRKSYFRRGRTIGRNFKK